MDNNIKNILNIYDQIFSQKKLLENITKYSPISNVRPNIDVDLRLEPSMSSILNNVAKEYGKALILTSAYRSEERNVEAGGAKGSLHMQGKAVDLVLPDMTNKEDILNFIQIASKNGVGGIGVYDRHIHLDNGSKRYWGPDGTRNTTPEWAEETLEKHVKDQNISQTDTDVATTSDDGEEYKTYGDHLSRFYQKYKNTPFSAQTNVFDILRDFTGISEEKINESLIKHNIQENIVFKDVIGKNNKYDSGEVVIPKEFNNKIKSAVSGRFNKVIVNRNCTNQVLIEFKSGRDKFYLEYCGITNLNVKEGDRISKNDVLGTTNDDVTVRLYGSDFRKKSIESEKNKNTTSSGGSRFAPLEKDTFLAQIATAPLKLFQSKKPKKLSEQVLKNMGIMNFRDLFNKMPEELQKRVYELKKIPQNKKWHPEGNVLKHTITVVNRSLKSDDINLAIAAIMHDIGKDETLKYNEKTNEPSAYGHENVSADLVKKYGDWIKSIGGDPELVYFIVKNHMTIKYFDQMKPSKVEKITSNPNYDKLSKFGEFDKGGLKIENKKLQENINKIKKIMK